MIERLNPSQPSISAASGSASSKEPTYQYERAYAEIEIVNRATNMIVDDVSEIPTAVGDQIKGVPPIVKGIRKTRVHTLLNEQPNPYQDINTFKRNLIVDFIIDGNIFIYYDGKYLFHLPACKITINPSTTTFVESYTYKGGQGSEDITYSPKEIIHIKENSFDSLYRGISRLRPAVGTMELLRSMKKFQRNFFKNGAVPGLVLKTPDTLSEKIKQRLVTSWAAKYRPEAGGKSPMILDGGLSIDSVSNVNFKELDFQQAIGDNEIIILKALGVPPILLDSGNNANIRPNLRLYYLETVLPIVRKLNFGYERFFGYTIREDITDIPALQPELKDQSAYYVSLVNGGIITVNEAREPLGLEDLEGKENNEVRIPANIAGSAANPDEGGAPAAPQE